MKKKIRKTGEIVDVITFTAPYVTDRDGSRDFVDYIDSKGVERKRVPMNIYWDFEDVEDEFTKEIDWEQVRIDAAIAAMNGILNNNELQSLAFDGRTDKSNRQIPVYVAEMTVAFADALISELKKGCEK